LGRLLVEGMPAHSTFSAAARSDMTAPAAEPVLADAH
jgi:hypothetical protein